MSVKIENNSLVVTMPLQKAASKSGKSIVIASTHGNVQTTAVVDGKPVTLGLNAYIKV